MAREIRPEEMRAVRTALASAPKPKRSIADMEQDVRDHLRGASAQPVAPLSDKHSKWLKAAEETLDLMCCNVPEAGDVREASIQDIATALANAEREGMKRAAEMLNERAQEFNKVRDPGMANHCRSLAARILSQAGEG